MLEPETNDAATDWDFRGCDTQYGPHGIHTYVAAMIPQLARRLIENYAPADGIVFDPFCGGGAVLVEAVNSGRPAIGRDINPLAILIAKAKTTPVNVLDAHWRLEQIIAKTDPMAPPPQIDRNLSYWFKPEHTGLIHSLRKSITSLVGDDDSLLPLFLTIFSSTVRDVSLTYRNEVRLRRMTPDEIAKFEVDPIVRFKERGKKAIAAISTLPGSARADVAVGNVKSMALEDNECAAIVCSPPYGDERNGVSYAQFSKNMLGWLGHSPDEIKEYKTLTLGWGNRARVAPTSPTLDAGLNSIANFPESVRQAVAFYADYQVALGEMARVTQGAIIIVIGQRVLRDTVFDNGAITAELMANLGVSLSEVFYRNLPSKRLPKMRNFGAAISKETILVFQK